MRVGMNPSRAVVLPSPSRVVVLVITHLPDLQDSYHARRMDVIRRSICTLMDNANTKYEFYIWDNGSCETLTEWLTLIYPDRLILSRNIGKINALKSVMRMLPPDTILAYGDDDIEYMPNWLAPQIQILETYPNVGTVTGWPVRITSKWGEEMTKTWAARSAQIEPGHFLPDAWERDYCKSVGRNYDEYQSINGQLPDYRITYKGVQVYAMSQHCQFVCYPERIEKFFSWTDRAMEGEIAVDKAIDAAGLLRLATVERYCRHLGNVLDGCQT